MTDPNEYTKKEAEEAVRTLLSYSGQNINREGLLETPKRHVKFWEDFLNPPKFKFTTFDAEGADEMIVIKDIPFYSLCEHHLLPFFGTASVGYIPKGMIVGLSKIPRALDSIARKPQNQERITKSLSELLMENLKPKGVAVIVTARHMCMEMRGVQKPGTETVTSSMQGVFKTDAICRQEFLNLIK